MVMENMMSYIPYLQWKVSLYYYEFLDKNSSAIKTRNNNVLGSKANTETANNRKNLLILLIWVLHLWGIIQENSYYLWSYKQDKVDLKEF